MINSLVEEKIKAKCFHCGDNILSEPILFNELQFCCSSCQTIYEILSESNLEDYYKFNSSPGKSQKESNDINYDFLENQSTIESLLNFNDNNIGIVTLYLPEIHCSSCIWLLENLFKIEKRLLNIEVNFLQKEALIKFKSSEINLKEIVKLLAKIGYPPNFSFDDLTKKNRINPFKEYYFKLGVAFFAFGNIMLLSFPEYFGLGELKDSHSKIFFGYLNFLLSLPVIFYSAQEFFQSAWNGLKQKTLNMDFPIVLGLIVMFLRSSYEIFSQTGAGFMDTLASLVFLMLIGRMFKNKSFDRISFDRDYRSYFPISVNKIKNEVESSIKISEIRSGDKLRIRNSELIPVDAILISDNASIDYSFVTGEANENIILAGEKLFAGGRNLGKSIDLVAKKTVSQSYLTSLWNNEAFAKPDGENLTTLANKVSGWFTLIVVVIAISTFIYWLPISTSVAINSFTAVLIITCPCALALSSPFTLGSVLRVFGKNNVYIKNTNVIEKLSKIDTIIFDKTGTITQNKNKHIEFISLNSEDITDEENDLIKSACSQSGHTLSRIIYNKLLYNKSTNITYFNEQIGLGFEAEVNNQLVKVGSYKYIYGDENLNTKQSTTVYIQIDNSVIGYFKIKNNYRIGLNLLLNQLKTIYDIYLISGDNSNEKNNLKTLFPNSNMYFNQKPQDKLNIIKDMNNIGKHTLMIGDGLNDAGALKQSYVGIAVTDEIGSFFPASDAVIDAQSFTKLFQILNFAKSAKKIIIFSFVLSFLYNSIGIYFAVTGTFSPVIAAIIMPISSVTIILFTTMTVNIIAIRKGL